MMSWGVGLGVGALIIWIDFLMPFKNSSSKVAAKRHPFCFPADLATTVQEFERKIRLNGRGCIFSRSPIVQVVAFRPVFEGAADPGAMRLR